MTPRDLLWRLPSSTSMGVVLTEEDMPRLRELHQQGLVVRHLMGWRRTAKGDLAACDPATIFGDLGRAWTDPPVPPVTRTAPTTIPCAASAPRKRPFPVWLAVALGFGLGAGVGQLWRILALFVVLGSVTGCDRTEWQIHPAYVWDTFGEPRGAGEAACRVEYDPIGLPLTPECFPCRTTDFVDARRVCDAAGIRKGGGK